MAAHLALQDKEKERDLTCARLEVVVLARRLLAQSLCRSEAWERNPCFACSRCFVLASATADRRTAGRGEEISRRAIARPSAVGVEPAEQRGGEAKGRRE